MVTHVLIVWSTSPGLTAYGFAVYCILVKNERGSGTPIAYFITSQDNTETLVTCLTSLKKAAEKRKLVFEPR
jgi:hypothetical protein